GVKLSSHPDHKYPIAELATKSGDRVYMTAFDIELEGSELAAVAESLAQGLVSNSEYKGIVFPMVSLDHRVDVSWVIGLETHGSDGQSFWVDRAVQQTRFRMNEFGARAQSAFAAAVAGCTPQGPGPYTLNQPFLIWIERTVLSKALFVGHIGTDDWKNPGDITS
ncbi:MAG TPA: hypothetical protein VEZ90_01985, partial [Blastocatellia bacterium]|nr:hypothetical protein [Blastocatellia bacterium]